MMDLVLGTGLAGLTLAQEADIVIGLPLHTASSFNIIADNYTFDRGIHVINTKTKETEIIELEQTERNAKIQMPEGLVDYPYQSVNTDCQFVGKGVNYKDFLINSFGEKDYNDFHRPYNEKFWGVPTEQMSSSWTKKPHFPKGKGANATFWYPKVGGIESLRNELKKRVEKKIKYGGVKFIDVNEKRVYCNNEWIYYDRLHNTIPITTLNTSLPLEALQTRLHNTSLYVYTFALNYTDLTNTYHNIHWVYFPDSNTPYIRISFPTNWNKGLAPAGKCIIQCESPYYLEEKPELFLYRDEIVRGDITLIGSDRIMPAYCIPLLDTEKVVEDINKKLELHNIFNYGRYGRWENRWIHEVMAEKIKKP